MARAALDRGSRVAGSGRLSIDYGLEIVARVRFDVTVGGTQYEWEGDIPIPGDIPRDLRLAAMMGFDSMLLPPQMPRPVAIADSASPILLAFDALGSIIPIPGISGGFEVAIQPRLEAGYRTTRVEVGDAMLPIELEGGSTVATADAGETGFGAAKDVVITPVGQLDYDGVVGLRPSLFIAIAGQRFELPIAELDVPLVVLDREIRFDPETVHVPLPDLRIEPRTVRFGEVELGVTGTALLEIRNEGEAPLHVTPRMARVPFGAPTAEVVVAPRSTRSIELTFSPDELGPVSAMLFVESNDPDESTVIVRLEGVGVASTSPDAGISTDGAIGGPSTAGGCACRAAGGAGGSPLGASGLAVSVLLLLTVRRRR